jgi:hypothetical protein
LDSFSVVLVLIPTMIKNIFHHTVHHTQYTDITVLLQYYFALSISKSKDFIKSISIHIACTCTLIVHELTTPKKIKLTIGRRLLRAFRSMSRDMDRMSYCERRKNLLEETG